VKTLLGVPSLMTEKIKHFCDDAKSGQLGHYSSNRPRTPCACAVSVFIPRWDSIEAAGVAEEETLRLVAAPRGVGVPLPSSTTTSVADRVAAMGDVEEETGAGEGEDGGAGGVGAGGPF
jgi:hypothetical protein